MNQCKDCVVDMICIKECPIFKIDLGRLQGNNLIYLKRCMNNIKSETYKISKSIIIKISMIFIVWYKNGKRHRDNDQPAIIYCTGSQVWYKNGVRHRDNDQPAVIHPSGEQYWFKNGVEYDPM